MSALKQKFSLNMGPTKTSSSKPESTPKETPQPSAHSRHDSKDNVCDFSPFINRRALTLQTERELRAACVLVLRNNKPSDHGMEDTDPKLDFSALSRRAADRRAIAPEVQVKKPSGAPADMKDAYVKARANTAWEMAAKTQPAAAAPVPAPVPARANTGRRRADSAKTKANFVWLDDRDDKRTAKAKQAAALKLATAQTQVDADAMATRRSNSFTYTSTAPTSAAPTSAAPTSTAPTSGSSNRRSRQLDNPAAIADAQASEWMRQELDKSKQHQASQRPSTANPTRTPSRARSIKDNVKRSLSRATSHRSLRKASTEIEQDSQEEKRPGSSNAWRSWGLPRRSTSRSNSRPGTSRENANEESQRGRPEVDLNRELPRLPGLDTWKEPEVPQEEVPQMPTSPTHIASLMRSHDEQQEVTSPVSHKYTRERFDSSMMPDADVQPEIPVEVRPDTSYSGDTIQARRLPKKNTTTASPGHLNLMMGEWATPPTITKLDKSNKASPSGHARQISMDSVSSPSTNASSQSARSSRNSRNMGMDAPQPKPAPKEEQKSRLRRALSGWMLKKERKDSRVHKPEGQGAREGFVAQESDAMTPEVKH
ncbi:hypothetical protein P153DRAFT_369373 [Dothidotthia symphoricarpi CBS 119687]|uniref:Uncharacterized protein n=1 Tax=Dothidotthia symphoricarpi CBS 119687 TaxID=1392245 RepID=A0A6A6A5V5_9PLEO|nr:uncharacterized protein P153DRAFT_369373 [Dothidotthia symphoricarpi CBS 119687]KAF2125991.1 hypothetical protein P153DRAFT_369373 [Dothidotthia symphoricarpi CBS 119687]